jgi:acetyl esterase/lipase
MKLYNFIIAAVLVFAVSCNKTKSTDTGTNSSTAAQTILNVSYGNDAAQKMDVYLPAGRTEAATKVMVLIHGGAWSSGDKTDLTIFADTIKKRLPDYAVFNINYRLSTGTANLFPTQENDVKAAIEYIYSKRSDYLISNKFVLNGLSAGGHLALLQAYKYQSPVKIKAVVDFFGPTDMIAMHNNPAVIPPATIALIVGATPAGNPALYQQSSPINFVTTQTSPTIIIQGGLDPLVNAASQSLVLKNKLTATGIANQYVFYPTGGHGDWDAATFTNAFNNIQAFLAIHNP